MLLWKDIKMTVIKSSSGFSKGLLDSSYMFSISYKANTCSVNQHLENFVLEHLVCMGVKVSGLNVSTKGAE